jgi:hypothetical protein
VLGGLARCSLCNSTMTRVAKGKKTKPYLVCTKAKSGSGCKYQAVPYQIIEETLIDQQRLLIKGAPKRNRDVDDELEQVDTAIDAIDDRIQTLIEAMPKGGSAAIKAEIAKLQAERNEFDAEQKELQEKLALTSLPLVQHQLKRVSDVLEGDDIATRRSEGWRTRTNVALRQLFSSVVIEVNQGAGELVFEWKAGKKTELSFFTKDPGD